MSAQKALQGSETETRELLGGTKEKKLICPPGILVQMGEDYEVPGKDDSSNSSSSVYLEV